MTAEVRRRSVRFPRMVDGRHCRGDDARHLARSNASAWASSPSPCSRASRRSRDRLRDDESLGDPARRHSFAFPLDGASTGSAPLDDGVSFVRLSRRRRRGDDLDGLAQTLGWLFFLSRGFGQAPCRSQASHYWLAAFAAAIRSRRQPFTRCSSALSFAVAFKSVGRHGAQNLGWQAAWSWLGWGLMLIGAPLFCFRRRIRTSKKGGQRFATAGQTLPKPFAPTSFGRSPSAFPFRTRQFGDGPFIGSILKSADFRRQDLLRTCLQKGLWSASASQLACGVLFGSLSYRVIFCFALAGYGVAVARCRSFVRKVSCWVTWPAMGFPAAH